MFDPFALDDDDTVDSIPRLTLSLRITGSALDPDFLTQQLGVAPSFSALAGDAQARDGGGSPDDGVWLYRLDVPPATELGEVIEMLLNLFPDDTTLWSELTSTYAVDLSCGVFLQGDVQRTAIGAEVFQRLGRLGLSLGFELYATGESEDDDA